METINEIFGKICGLLGSIDFSELSRQNFYFDISDDLQEIFNPQNRVFDKRLWYIVYIIVEIILQIITIIMKTINYIFLDYPENPGVVGLGQINRIFINAFSDKHDYAFLNNLNTFTELTFQEKVRCWIHPGENFIWFFNKFAPQHLVSTLSHVDNGLMIPDRSVNFPENYKGEWDYLRVLERGGYRSLFRYNSSNPDLYDYSSSEVKAGNYPLAEEQTGFVRYLNPIFDIDLTKHENYTEVRDYIILIWSDWKHRLAQHDLPRMRPFNHTPGNIDGFLSDKEYEGYKIWDWFFGPNYFVPKVDYETVPKPMILSEMSGNDIRSEDIYYETFEIIHMARLNMVLLPDKVSEFLQKTFNFTDTTYPYQIINTIKFWIKIFGQMVSIRFSLFWFLSINPYQSLLLTLFVKSVDWVENLFGALPLIIYGIPVNLMVVGYLVDSLIRLVSNLYLTFPYLPSEGKLKYLHDDSIFNTHPFIWYEMVSAWERKASTQLFMADGLFFHLFQMDNEGTIRMPKMFRAGMIQKRFQYTKEAGIHDDSMHPIFKYEGLPKLWLENGIPNNLRTYWFWERPTAFKEFYNQFEEARLNSNLELLPDYVIKDLKQNVSNLDLSNLSKLKIQDLYEFLFDNLSQPLMADLMKQLNSEFQTLDIKVSDYLDIDTIFYYRNLLENFNPTDFPLIY